MLFDEEVEAPSVEPAEDPSKLAERSRATVDPSDPSREPVEDPSKLAERSRATVDPDPDMDPPQPDGDSLEVVTTGPEDGRIGQGRRSRAKPNGHTGGLSPDDPFWTFGTPPETWGSTRGPGAAEDARTHRPRLFLECRDCGVKIEKKRAHGRGRVPCPMCGRFMRQSRQD